MFKPMGVSTPLYPDRAEDRLKEILATQETGQEDNSPVLGDVLASSGARDAVLAVLGSSPFLWRICAAEPKSLAGFLAANDQESSWEQVENLLKEAQETAKATDRNQLMSRLREIRRRVALLVALSELRGLWNLEQVTGALSRFADICLDATLTWLLADAHRRGELPEIVPVEKCGLTFLGMGKYGARELNYSSDIDLISLYEPGVMLISEKVGEKALYVRLTRDTSHILQTPTALGYVFRVDLRLRPDAGSTAVAISVPAALDYYEHVGRNWERAAYIKAAAVAGDKGVGQQFLKELRPFVWRKSLDADTIKDIHLMKQRTHALKRARDAASGQGYDIKRGAGGIRAIEFFVQAQQLIAGGKDETLRISTTCGGLDALAESGWINSGTAQGLEAEYRFLRTLEHRIQMVNDEQTHALPRSAEEMDSLARFSGFADGTELWTNISDRLDEVERLVSGLFKPEGEEEEEKADEAAEAEVELVFPPLEDDPDSLQKLSEMGFANPSRVSSVVREWIHGRALTNVSEHARALLAKFVPDIMKAAVTTGDPDATVTHFDTLLRSMPAEMQLFALFESNPKILLFLVRISSSAPRLATYLQRKTRLIDTMLAPFTSRVTTHGQKEVNLQKSFESEIEGATNYADKIELLRERVYEERFRLGMQLLSSNLSPRDAGRQYSDLACTATRILLPLVVGEEKLAPGARAPKGQTDEEHPEIPVVVAMGKMGSEELSAESDLDLIVLYDERPLGEDAERTYSAWYQRVTQKLIAALGMPTMEGKLFEVDMRLRPSGASGPITTSLEGFADYQFCNAWTWEHMALTRAKVITGAKHSQKRMVEIIRKVLCRRRNLSRLASNVAEMRQRIWKEKATRNPWDLKHARGGLVDIEFISQYLQLAHAHKMPEVLKVNNRDAFSKFAEAGVLAASDCDLLIQHWDMLHGLTQVLRICMEGAVQATEIPEEFHSLLARAGGVEDFEELRQLLAESQERVHRLFEKVMEVK